MATTLEIASYDIWQEGVDDLIQLTRSRFARKGIHLTEEETYRYFCWCYANTVDAVMSQLDSANRRLVTEIIGVVSDTCSAHFRQKRLGVLDPPTGKGILASGYKDLDDYHQKRSIPTKLLAEKAHAPGGYL